MATAQVSPDLPRPSFAKVAASVSNDNLVQLSAMSSSPLASSPLQPQARGAPPAMTNHLAPDSVLPHRNLSHTPGMLGTSVEESRNVDSSTASLADLHIGCKVPKLVLNQNSSTPEMQQHPVGRESGSEESQKGDSGSDVGTKPPSLDGKSNTSGTTFAMDEKESLRPDDSASVKAAAEEDDTFLMRGSRMGSELAAKPRNAIAGDVLDRRLPLPSPGAHGSRVLTPQSASSEHPPSLESAMPLCTDESSDALNVIYRQAPDEKLLDALSSPRDRFFLLRLEKDVVEFVQDSKEPYMDLPPSNSFCRMLTHKLADYYHMTHSFEPHIGSVRIFRTPFCRVPPSLATMVPPSTTSNSSTPPPALLPRKIMRRGQDGDGILTGASASKPTSESGSDAREGKDKQPPAKEKLSREEREEMYKLARERIFGSSEEAGLDNEGENAVSRASSVSTNNRVNAAKRGKVGKQRRDDSDSFDSRHQYTPCWGPQQQTWVPQTQNHFPPPNHGQFSAQSPAVFPGQQAMPLYSQQGAGCAGIPGMSPSTVYPAPYGVSQFAGQPPPPRCQPGSSPLAAYGNPVPPAAVAQGRQPGLHAPAYQSRGPSAPASQSQIGVPYPFGQLPANVHPSDPKSQHPIPGSYNRNHAFNPKTQSFIPGANGMLPAQSQIPPPPPPPPFAAPASHQSSPQMGTPHLAFPGFHAAMPPQQYGGEYGMARQGSNNSAPPYHSVPHGQHGPLMQAMPPVVPQHLPPHPPTQVPSRAVGVSPGPGQLYSHLPTYGNPATLPQKPGPGI